MTHWTGSARKKVRARPVAPLSDVFSIWRSASVVLKCRDTIQSILTCLSCRGMIRLQWQQCADDARAGNATAASVAGSHGWRGWHTVTQNLGMQLRG